MLSAIFETGCLIALGVGMLAAFGQQTGGGTGGALKVGDSAPDFSLKDQDNKPVTLAGFRGKENVVLAFFPLAFTSG